MRRFHYFDQAQADPQDVQLRMAIGQGYVPAGCLLAGDLVMEMTRKGQDACSGCQGPRERCQGRPVAADPPPGSLLPWKAGEPEPPEPGPDQLDTGRARP